MGIKSLSAPRKDLIFHGYSKSVLVDGCKTWTLTKELVKRTDGCYTCLLRVVKGIDEDE